ncbi:hypothetical protein EST38_g7083 [Candolleomyces aberdarensis]|uniref:BRCT domain-containing protein n=1 Tax=Candolleomyces aberdarensis TaxID=2316362 RepID=A0A4Q2DIW6_9AGAR|nr:hypothetical protein EST38_g7083 [Candolleomyces aberdarensis]
MKRRTNKSHRVPNVKLRPGQAQSSTLSLAKESSFWLQDSQIGSDDTAIRDTCPRPFKNVVLCATGIPDKPALFKKALELGASTISAFTDKVTHLVAVSHGGAKYKCALEHNVPIVKPSWVEENYDIWLHGDDVEPDLSKSIGGHRLPIFSDVVLCLSGIPELERRADIRRIVEEQGGQYVKAIERPVRVTHLLCSGEEETDKMRYAEKFAQRGEAQIHLVWEDWFWDSLMVNGRLDESRYNIRNPRPPVMVPRNTQPNIPDSTVPSRSNSMNAPAPEESEELDAEAARVNIVPDITLKVWTGLLERRGYEMAEGEIIRSPTKSQNQSRSVTPPQPQKARSGRPSKTTGVISAVRRINTFEAAEKVPSQRTLPFKRGKDASAPPEEEEAAGPSNQSRGETSKSDKPPQVFNGMRFCLLGEADTPGVRSAIQESGGTVTSEYSSPGNDVDIYLVRLLSGSSSSLLFGLSGLDQSESCHTKRLLKAFGINLIPLFSKKATHLLCPSGVGLKFEKAREWGIPVVSYEWLAAIVSTGTIPSPGQHIVEGPSQTEVPSKHEPAVDTKGKGKAVDTPVNPIGSTTDKGKGRLRSKSMAFPIDEDDMDVDPHMNDITNKPLDPEPGSSKAALAKAGSLERQPTAIIPEGQPVLRGFGQPTEVLGSFPNSSATSSSYYAHPSSIKPLSQATPLVKYGTNPKSHSIAHTLNESMLLEQEEQQKQQRSTQRGAEKRRPNKSRKLTDQSTPSRKSSTGLFGHPEEDGEGNGNGDGDNPNIPIPSSKSPSPMKGPRRLSSMSPTKMDPGAAKALQESIASLLGKRQSPEDDEDNGVGDSLPRVESAAELSNEASSDGNKAEETTKSRSPAKRKRPQRAKPVARAKASRRKSPPAPSAQVEGVSLSAFDPYGAGGAAGGDEESQRHEEQSLRVVYEDPAQLQERERLINLLGKTSSKGSIVSQEESISTMTLSGSSARLSGVSTRSSTRRSARVSGF